MTGQAEIKIPYQDLTKITIVCQHCQGEITADLTQEKQNRLYTPPGPRNEPPPEMNCTMCGEPMDSGLPEALKSLRQWYQKLRDTRYEAFFRIKAPAQ